MNKNKANINDRLIFKYLNGNATEKEIQDAKDKITYLESLHENYYIGMNVFRTAKGGRDKIKS